MKKKQLLLVCIVVTCFLFISNYRYLHCQSSTGSHTSLQHYINSNGKVNWISRDNMPGNLLAFEENKGQFPAMVNGWTLLYRCHLQGIEIFLTDKGIIYNISKITYSEEASNVEGNGPDREPGKMGNVTYQHIFIGFKDCSANVQIEAKDETSYYFCEGIPENPKATVTDIKGFKKIVYLNIYPGIDIEFSIHEGNRIKYALRVKPGIDAGIFKMIYRGTTGLSLDTSGNLHIGTLLGDIIDLAPVVTSEGKTIPSSFKMTEDNEISFELNNDRNKKEVIIDPWTVFPVTPATYACDVAMDVSDNTYVLEYHNSSILMYVQKYNPAGLLVWTYALNEFTATPFNPIEMDSSKCKPFAISDFVADANGNTYIANSFGFINPFANNSFDTYGMVSLNNLGQRN